MCISNLVKRFYLKSKTKVLLINGQHWTMQIIIVYSAERGLK